MWYEYLTRFTLHFLLVSCKRDLFSIIDVLDQLSWKAQKVSA